MKLLKNTNLEKNLVELEIRVDGEEYEKALENSFKKNSKKLNIPGFRKGKAPRATILKYVGEEYFWDDAVNNTCYNAYGQAVEESKIDVVDAPSIEVKDINNEGYTFTAKVYTKPEISIKGYKGLTAEKEDDTVTDEELQRSLDALVEKQARLIEVTDRAAQANDETEIAYEGFCDGKAFQGGKSECAPLKLGSNTFIPGFEDQIIGHKIGDEFDVNVTFPAEYFEEKLAGKAAVFKTKLLSIKVKELPKLDDDFAKDVSEFDTLEELKADELKKLQESKTKRYDMDVENILVDKAAELIEGDIPECMYKNKAEDLMEDFGYRLQMQGMNLDDYFKYTGQTHEAMIEQMMPEATRQVKVALALEKIAELEKIEVSDEDIEKEYQNTANNYGVDVERAKKSIPVDDIKQNLKLQKAIDVIRDNAKITVKKDKKSK